MIDKLERTAMVDNCGNCYGYHNITEHEMVAKINEIIDWINKESSKRKLTEPIKYM